MKKYIGMVILLIVAVAVPAWAVSSTWTDGGADSLWSTAGNWDTGVPTGVDDATITEPGSVAIIDAGTAVANNLRVADESGPAHLEVTGGTLDVAAHLYLGFGEGSASTGGSLAINGGDVNVTGNLFLGNWGTGALTNSSGTLTVGGWFVLNEVGSNGSTSHLQVDGGVIDANVFSMRENASMDITGDGYLIYSVFEQDWGIYDNVADLISHGYITANGGADPVIVANYLGRTVLSAVPIDLGGGGVSEATVLDAARATLTIDGDASDWDNLASSTIYMDSTPVPANGRSGDLGVDIRYAWDTDYFYILVAENTTTVAAGTVQEAPDQTAYTGGPWLFDTMAFFMDLKNIAGIETSDIDRDYQPWLGFSSTALPLKEIRVNNTVPFAPGAMDNALVATGGTFANNDRTIEVAIAWLDIETNVDTSRQPNGSIIGSLAGGLTIGIEPLLIFNKYDVGQTWYNGPGPIPSGVDTNSVDVRLMGFGYSAFATEYDLQQGADGDDDTDGLSNLYEYGLGGNPTSGVMDAILPTYNVVDVAGSDVLEYVYPRRKSDLSALNYYLELTDNLAIPAWINAGYTVMPLQGDINADFEAVTNQIPTAGHSEEFIRLIIEQQ